LTEFGHVVAVQRSRGFRPFELVASVLGRHDR
jgi:hypothetical protein